MTDFVRWTDKDPAEQVTVAFDFSAVATSVSSPTVTNYTHWSRDTVDATPSAMLSGSPTINGAVVYQTVIGGVDWNNYVLNCKATTQAGEIVMVAALLPVRKKQ